MSVWRQSDRADRDEGSATNLHSITLRSFIIHFTPEFLQIPYDQRLNSLCNFQVPAAVGQAFPLSALQQKSPGGNVVTRACRSFSI
jgi:hypothetical protein